MRFERCVTSDGYWIGRCPCMTEGDIAAAAKLYRRIIDANPSNLHAVHFLGVAEAAAGNIDRAKLLMTRSLQIEAGQFGVH